MVAPATSRVTYAEYLALEAASAVRHAYVAGSVVEMAGGGIEHGRLIAPKAYLLRGALADKPGVVLASDVRVRIRAAERATYPDIFVVCGEIFRRAGPRRWTVEEMIAGERLALASVGVELAVDDLYRDGL